MPLWSVLGILCVFHSGGVWKKQIGGLALGLSKLRKVSEQYIILWQVFIQMFGWVVRTWMLKFDSDSYMHVFVLFKLELNWCWRQDGCLNYEIKLLIRLWELFYQHYPSIACIKITVHSEKRNEDIVEIIYIYSKNIELQSNLAKLDSS